MAKGKQDAVLKALCTIPQVGNVLARVLIDKNVITQEELREKAIEMAKLSEEEFDKILNDAKEERNEEAKC